MNLEQTLKALLEKVQSISRSETVVGEPRQIGEATLVPISRLRVGFAVGTHDRGQSEAKGKAEGGVTGGGILVDPVAILYINKEGQAQLFLLAKEGTPVLARIIDLIPDAVDRIIGRKKEEEGKQKD